LSIVRSGVRNYLSKTKAAGVLRMAFHDAGTFDIDDNSGINLIFRCWNYLLNHISVVYQWYILFLIAQKLSIIFLPHLKDAINACSISILSAQSFAGGMNGSIVYELDRPENAGLTKPLKVYLPAR